MLTRRTFLGILVFGSSILGGVAVAHHRPGHRPKPSPSPSPSSSLYSNVYSNIY
jgi:hypothetical protein